MPPSDTPVIGLPPKLLDQDQVCGMLRVKPYSIRTERAYVGLCQLD